MSHAVLFPDLWFCNKKFQNSMISAWVGAPQNWPGDKFSRPRKSKFLEVAIVTFK